MVAFGAGQVLAAADLNAVMPVWWIKAVDENLNNGGGAGTILQGDDELNLPVVANTTYKVDALVIAIEAAGSGIDLKVAWSQPALCILDLGPAAPHVQWPAPAAGNLEVEWNAWKGETAVLTASRSFGTNNTVPFSYHFRGSLRVGANAGFFRLQWAQANASASNLTVQAGSSIFLTPTPA